MIVVYRLICLDDSSAEDLVEELQKRGKNES